MPTTNTPNNNNKFFINLKVEFHQARDLYSYHNCTLRCSFFCLVKFLNSIFLLLLSFGIFNFPYFLHAPNLISFLNGYIRRERAIVSYKSKMSIRSLPHLVWNEAFMHNSEFRT